MGLFLSGLREWVHLGRLLFIEKIVRSDIKDWFATTQDIGNGAKYMVKLKRTRL